MLVDDHALFRAGLAVLLTKLEGIGRLCEYGTGASALESVIANAEIDLLILDYELPDMSGLEVLAKVKKHAPELPVILLSANIDSNLIQNALAQHASGFIPKTSSPDVMLSAIKLVLNGGMYIPPEAIAEPVEKRRDPLIEPLQSQTDVNGGEKIQLTQRQMDVLMQMKHGYSNKEIARALNMSPSTVKVHVAAILKELDVSSRTQAVFIAKDFGLLD